ncbi:MAG TPA: NTP transferase domain-containing protein [Bacteroidales bacterium]|nr:NTP transferase domain-containing protein [Bacteroidales bacterium]
MSWAAVVLAAGNSTRMRQHKALLEFDSQQTFVQKIVREYISAGCSHIVVVANEQNMDLISGQFANPAGHKPILVLNKHPEYERFYSVQLGLKACHTFTKCFLQPCDNPFVNADLLTGMLQILEDGSYVAPVYNGKKGHPVLLGIQIMCELCASDEINGNLKDFLRTFNCLGFETSDPNILANINDMNDYQVYFKRDNLI